jgi:cholesterol transport system auxiliary component
MIRTRLGWPFLMSTIFLAGCAGAPVPDVAYYRMPEVAASKLVDAKHFGIPIVVDSLIADGVYNDQAILYALRSEGSIKAYHYQLWDEPPGQLLQRRLIDTLRARNAAKLITDRLPPSIDSLRISGRIERFERVKTEAGWLARVRLELRAEHGTQQEPLLLSEYGADVPTDADSIQATVRAFAAAIDQSYDAFWSELQQVPQ